MDPASRFQIVYRKDTRHLSLITALALLTGVLGTPQAATGQTVCPDRTGELAIRCIQSNYTPDETLGYDAARDVLYRDIEATDANELTGIYSGYTITLTPGDDPSTDAFEKGINAEHVFPQSKGAGVEPQKSDMHSLYPANSGVNSSRSNSVFGESPDNQTAEWYIEDRSQTTIPSSNIDAYSERLGASAPGGPLWEPREAREGDIARATLYFYAVYRAAADDGFFEEMQSQLLQWHQIDPVTQAEEARSAAIAAEQGNENPFVVDESLAGRTFGTTSGPALVFNPVQVEAGEGEGSTTLTVRYNSPDGASVTADVAFAQGSSSASQADIGGFSSKEVSFPVSAPDGATRSVTVPLTDDSESEGEEAALFQITNVSSTGGAQAGTNSSAALTITDNEQTLVLNELLADPAPGADGDANQDGTRDAADDEFVEIYNTSPSNAVDLSGYELSDGVGTRHVFPQGTTVGPEEAIVVFGGGAPAASIPGVVQTASSGALALNNGGDNLTLRNGQGTEVFSVTYDGSVDDESIARNPQFTGPFVAHSTIGSAGGDRFSPGRTPGGDPLPVELASIEAASSGEGVVLSWRTASETNNAGFEVQRRVQGGEAGWRTLHFENGAGTSASGRQYRFTDTDVPFEATRLTYRLRQVDAGGSATLSRKVTVRREAPGRLQMRPPFPNPATGSATVQLAIPEGTAAQGEIRLELYDTMGRRVRSVDVTGDNERHAVRLRTGGLASGLYVLRLQAGGDTRVRRLTVVR